MGAANVGGRWKDLRELKGWSQRQLADAAGMSAPGIADLEQGRREPAWRTVLALAEALGVDCTAFAVPPADRPKTGRGRPRKALGVASGESSPQATNQPAAEPKAAGKAKAKRGKGHARK